MGEFFVRYNSSCDSCLLAKQRGLAIEPTGQHDIVFISDGPSSADIFEGSPFKGPEGTLLYKVLEYNGIPKSSTFITYACMCRLSMDKVKKGYQKTEMQQCRKRLVDHINKLSPRIVIPLGNVAIQSLLGSKLTVSTVHGQSFWSDEIHAWIMPTFNPKALMKSPKNFSEFEQDISKIHVILNGGTENLKEELKTECWVADTPKRAMQAINFLKTQRKVACDIETQGFNFRKHKVYCLACSWQKGKAIIFTASMLADPFISHALKHFLESPTIDFIWHNGKFDIKFFPKYNIKAKVDRDTMLKHYAVDERRGTHDLEQVSQILLGAIDYKSQFWKKWKPFIMDLPAEALIELYEYCGSDADYTFRIDDVLEARLIQEGALRAYKELLIPASNVFAEIEQYGFWVDAENLQAAEDKYELIVNGLRESLNEVAFSVGWDPLEYQKFTGAKKPPKEFNVNSWQQLGYVLFDLLGLPMHKGKRSTDEDALTYLANKVLGRPKEKYYEELYKPRDTDTKEQINELKKQEKAAYKSAVDDWTSLGAPQKFVQSLMTYREKKILLSTFIGGIRRALQDDGRIHASFLLHATETGRLACKEPNMQNMPRLSEIRNILSVPPGYKLLQGDYSQAELRVLAVLSQDPFLMKVYYDGGDLHDAVALKLFGEGFTKEQRVRAKAVNFGLAYGRTEFTIAEEYDIPVEDARFVIQEWFANIPVAGAYIKARRQDPKHTGETVTTVYGRRRRFPLITEDNAWNIENEAVNFPISSTAADLTLKSTILINEEFKRQNIDAHIINEVHDSIMVEVRDECVDQAIEIMRYVMQTIPGQVLNTDMPFKADFEIGTHWGSLAKIKKAA